MTVGEFAPAHLDRAGRRWKPGTRTVVRSYLRRQILPWFARRPVAAVDRPEVRRWIASLHATPAAANRSLPILSGVMIGAEVEGLRPAGSNPCRGVRPLRTRPRERHLSEVELGRLGAALDARAADPRAALVRLLALTGCRHAEIRTLRWREVRAGQIFLADSKTGPRTVWLSAAARQVLAALPRSGDRVFPSPAGMSLRADKLYDFWRQVRLEAGLAEARLHDLRHTFASTGLRQGETVLAIGRLLGHQRATTTLRYIHFADDEARDAVAATNRVLSL